MNNQTTHGRCIALGPERITLRNEKGIKEVVFSELRTAVSVGDLVEITNGAVTTVTPNRTPSHSMQWTNKTLDPRRIKATRVRSQVEIAIRDFFTGQGFLETRTPLLVPCPGMEPHIRPFRVADDSREIYLPTSPEFAMKRLLVGGLEKIFQLCPAFRDEPVSVTHHPEFTMLEWYRAYANYEGIMRDTEQLFEFIAMRIHGCPELSYQGQKISVATPWPRLRIRELFLEFAEIDLVGSASAEKMATECRRLGLPADLSRENWDDLYFKIWLNVIEPRLPSDRAVFVMRYPASQAALSVIDNDPDGSLWARRFEAYAGGLELGNAFEELTDPVEQRARFVKDMDLRAEIYGPSFPRNPLDEGFLEALAEGMPPSGGIAMGVDRMVMLFADEPEIGRTFWIGA